MVIPLYVPKWLIVSIIVISGCALGWMLHAPDGEVRPALMQNDDVVADGFQAPAAVSGGRPGAGSSPFGGLGAGSAPDSGVTIRSTPGGLVGDAYTVNTAAHVDTRSGGSGRASARLPSATRWPYGPGRGVGAPRPEVAFLSAPVGAGRSSTGRSTPTPSTGGFAEPSFFGAELFTPLPGAASRGVAFSEWESYRTDVAGRNILVTTDDSDYSRDRIGKVNGNTGDTDASGLNIVDATDSVIHGTESADEAPYQTVTAGLVDLASDAPGGGLGSDPDAPDGPDVDEDESDEDDAPPPAAPVATPALAGSALAALAGSSALSAAGSLADAGPTPTAAPAPAPVTVDVAPSPTVVAPPTAAAPVSPVPSAAPAPAGVAPAVAAVTPVSPEETYDFPYRTWTDQINPSSASAVHTDEGTTLASGADALVIGGDGYDDDDNRALGEDITITRDDGNVIIGGVGDANSQVGDSEQGAVIMDVTRTYIQGGGAY